VAVYKFAYTQIQIPPSDPFPLGQTACRPLLRAQIVSESGQEVACLVCLDTGADHCVFPALFLPVLGLDPLTMKMQMTGGVGSIANPTYYADVTINMHVLVPGPNPGDAPTSKILSFSTKAGFTAGLDAQGLGLLGQTGFFEKYACVFNHKAKYFIVDEA
jgi:hypothetical protein